MGRAALLVNNEYEEYGAGSRKRSTKGGTKPTRTSTKAANQAAPAQKLHLQLKRIEPLNETQRQMIDAFMDGYHVVAEGSAGTGKSYLGCYLALNELMEKNVSSVKIIRSAVPTRNQGFLPGSLEEKSAVYELPYKDIVNDLMGNGTAYEVLSKKGVIEFQTTSFLRGLTFRDCVIVLDEFQNLDKGEVFTVLSRIGPNCKIIICGDTKQKDLSPNQSGFEYLMKLSTKMPDYIDVVHFTSRDIVRSEFVKQLIMIEEES